jgi:hypothetical protein
MEDYASAARARQEDVRVLRTGTRDLAAVYMSGYVAECHLKALLRIRGEPFPTSGGAGHDLRVLWSAAGFKLRDAGEKGSTFISSWTTSLRYKSELPSAFDRDQLLEGAEAASTLIARRQRAERTTAARKRRRGT